jgi:hypothetical protein
MLADPAVRAAIAVAFLNGQRAPTIESSQTEFDTLGMQWRAYHDFGVGMEETTAAVRRRHRRVNAADLVIDERAAEPAVGDRILVGELDDALAYEVMNVDGERCWRWADSFRLTYRIHTKFVGAQPPAR